MTHEITGNSINTPMTDSTVSNAYSKTVYADMNTFTNDIRIDLHLK